MESFHNKFVKKEILEDYYDREVVEWLLVEHDEHHTIIDYSFISVIFNDGVDILPLKNYMRHYKLKNII
jgi:hypothetical protein